MEIEEINRDRERIINEKDKFKQQGEKLKIDLIKIKKAFEQEKESLMKQRIDDIMKLQFEIHEQKSSQKQLQDINDLKQKINKNVEVKKYIQSKSERKIRSNRRKNIKS
jgi:hypothetical protein